MQGSLGELHLVVAVLNPICRSQIEVLRFTGYETLSRRYSGVDRRYISISSLPVLGITLVSIQMCAVNCIFRVVQWFQRQVTSTSQARRISRFLSHVIPHGLIHRRLLPLVFLLKPLHPHISDNSIPLPTDNNLRNPHDDQDYCANQSWCQHHSARPRLFAHPLAPLHILHIDIL